LRGRLEAQHQLIKDVSTFLDECVVSPDGATRHRLEQIRGRIDLEEAAYAERLGPVDSGRSADAGAESQKEVKEVAASVAR
jgi:hypothetical protein